jgi:hypothetical protein
LAKHFYLDLYVFNGKRNSEAENTAIVRYRKAENAILCPETATTWVLRLVDGGFFALKNKKEQ